MKITDLGESDLSGPQSFEKFKQQSAAVFPFDLTDTERTRRNIAPPAFRITVKRGGKRIYGYDSQPFPYDPDSSMAERKEDETAALQDHLSFLKRNYGSKFADLQLRDLKVEPVYYNRPELKRIPGSNDPNQVIPSGQNALPTASQTLAAYIDNINDVERQGITSVANIRAQVAYDADQAKLPYYDMLLSNFIDTTGGSGFTKPVIVSHDIDQELLIFGQGKKKTTELLVNFGEVIGPVGLICNTVNGNGARLLPDFLKEPDRKKIIDRATIHFPPGGNFPLVDSFIEYQGQVIRLSSKAAGQKLSGGQGTSMSSLYRCIDEIQSNPSVNDAFAKFLQEDKKRMQALKFLRTLSSTEFLSLEDFDEGMAGFVSQMKILNTLSPNGNTWFNDRDLDILKNLWDREGTEKGMHRQKPRVGKSLGSQYEGNLPDIGQFSENFQQLLKKYLLNRFAEPSLRGSEEIKKSSEGNEDRGWWRRLQKAIMYQTALLLNQDEAFSDVCVWLLSHSNFMQVDLRHSETQQRRNGPRALYITNVVATWPVRGIDRVKININHAGSDFKFYLAINEGGNDPDVEADINRALENPGFVDTLDFGFGGDTDVVERAAPTTRDLYRDLEDWGTMGVVDLTGRSGAVARQQFAASLAFMTQPAFGNTYTVSGLKPVMGGHEFNLRPAGKNQVLSIDDVKSNRASLIINTYEPDLYPNMWHESDPVIKALMGEYSEWDPTKSYTNPSEIVKYKEKHYSVQDNGYEPIIIQHFDVVPGPSNQAVFQVKSDQKITDNMPVLVSQAYFDDSSKKSYKLDDQEQVIIDQIPYKEFANDVRKYKAQDVDLRGVRSVSNVVGQLIKKDLDLESVLAISPGAKYIHTQLSKRLPGYQGKNPSDKLNLIITAGDRADENIEDTTLGSRANRLIVNNLKWLVNKGMLDVGRTGSRLDNYLKYSTNQAAAVMTLITNILSQKYTETQLNDLERLGTYANRALLPFSVPQTNVAEAANDPDDDEDDEVDYGDVAATDLEQAETAQHAARGKILFDLLYNTARLEQAIYQAKQANTEPNIVTFQNNIENGLNTLNLNLNFNQLLGRRLDAGNNRPTDLELERQRQQAAAQQAELERQQQDQEALAARAETEKRQAAASRAGMIHQGQQIYAILEPNDPIRRAVATIRNANPGELGYAIELAQELLAQTPDHSPESHRRIAQEITSELLESRGRQRSSGSRILAGIRSQPAQQ
jgi:hypothetical protein